MRPISIIVFTIVAVLAVIIVMILGNVVVGALFALITTSLGLDPGDDVTSWIVGGLFFAALFLVPKHRLAWNHAYRCHGAVLIDAPIAHVWDRVRICERDDYFTSATKRIRAVNGTPAEYKFLFDPSSLDDEAQMPDYIHIRVTDEVDQAYCAYEILNADALPLFGKDHTMSEVFLSQEADGVRVTYVETLSRLTLLGFVAFLFLNPCRDAMTSLKAQIEGTPNPSFLVKLAEEARADGDAPDSLQRAVRLGGATAMIFVTALTFGLVYALLWFITPG